MNKLLLIALSALAITSTNIYAQLTENDQELILSVQKGDLNIERTKALIAAGANVNAVDLADGNNTVLHKAQGTKTLFLLLQRGANPLVRNKKGTLPIQTILETYCTRPRNDAGDYYFNRDTDFDKSTDAFTSLVWDMTAKDLEELIYIFSGYKNPKPLKWLLTVKPKDGSSVNINETFRKNTPYKQISRYGRLTPLARATHEVLLDNMRLLLANGADDYQRNSTAGRPIDVAAASDAPTNKEAYTLLKDFDEKGPLGPAGVKEAEELLESGMLNSKEYRKLSATEKETQNNLLFRYAMHCEKENNSNAASIVLEILDNRFADLTEYQKLELPNIDDKMVCSVFNMTGEIKFNETEFKKLAAKFLWGKDKENKLNGTAVDELARKSFASIANMLNTTWTKESAGKTAFYAEISDFLEVPNGLIDYLYSKTLSLPAGARTAMVAALDLAIDMDYYSSGGYWSANKDNIDKLIKSEKEIDPKLRTIIDSKNKEVDIRVKEITDMMLKVAAK